MNLFIPTTSTFKVGKRDITITQTGNMPWEGLTEITVAPAKRSTFSVKVRIPGWAREEAGQIMNCIALKINLQRKQWLR